MGISFNEYSLQAGHLENVSSFDKSYSDEGDDNDEVHHKHERLNLPSNATFDFILK